MELNSVSFTPSCLTCAVVRRGVVSESRSAVGDWGMPRLALVAACRVHAHLTATVAVARTLRTLVYV